MSHKYKIVEEKENILDNVIEKNNISVKFTLGDLQQDVLRAEKMLKEAQAQLEVDEAAKVNISTNNPFVLKATEKEMQDAHALTLYRQYINKIEESKIRIKNIEDYFKGYYDELKVIKEQTNLEMPNDKS